MHQFGLRMAIKTLFIRVQTLNDHNVTQPLGCSLSQVFKKTVCKAHGFSEIIVAELYHGPEIL